MISYLEALQSIVQHAQAPQTETVPLRSALSKISAADVASKMHVPSFRNSAMDGFAVRCADIAKASAGLPVTLPVRRAIAAGDVVMTEGEYCCAVQIMTGAPVPEPYDAVIPVEDVIADAHSVTFKRAAKGNENIRFPGEDVQLGQIALRRGEAISAERIMLLSSLGVGQVDVYTLPPIHILSTGKELTDDMFAPLPAGKIYNSNAPYLEARCAEEGFTAQYGGLIADDAEEFEKRIQAIPAGCVIITTGAVSKGVWDFIPESLKRLGAHTHFHRVNIRPGKPVLCATLANGSWFFGLPGNPISAAIGFRFFVLPLMHTIQGLELEQPLTARLKKGFVKKGNFRQFLKATVRINACGELLATVSSGQESFRISPMAESNAWVMLEEERTECVAGALVAVFPFGAHAKGFLAHSFKEVLPCKAV
jgi:molybdopterin molybdotransferase